jgi:hypothetical protein
MNVFLILSRATAVAALLSGLLVAQQNPAPVSVLPTGNDAIDKYNRDYLKLTRTLMMPKNVGDSFGRRIGQRYIAMQITVANRNSEYQWLITDGAINLERLLENGGAACTTRFASLKAVLQKNAIDGGPNPHVTGSDLTVLRGVAEKGQLLDPRNLTFRILQGSGTIAAGLLGVTTFGPAFAPAVAAFNGPLLAAYQSMFPDQTVNQLNRLNDSTYSANTVVPKQQAKVLVVFVPMALLLTREEQKQFYSDPNKVFEDPCADLRLLDASVNGHYVTQLDLAPVITSVSITAVEAAKFATDNLRVEGVITGRFLDGAALAVASAAPGLTISATGTATAERMGFELGSVKPIDPNTPITITVGKTGLSPSSFTITPSYVPARPTIGANGLAPSTVAQGDTKVLTITGTGFTPASKFLFTDSKGLALGDPEYVSTSQIKVSVAVAADAVEGQRDFVISTVGGNSGKATLTISKK